jgi:hypothetical protein
MDGTVVDLFVVATNVGLSARRMRFLLENGDEYPTLSEVQVEERRLTSFGRGGGGGLGLLTTGTWSSDEVLRDTLLLPTIKRNLRTALSWEKLDICTKVTLDLGFTDPFLYLDET